jgi:uncharacterized SAM-binding protein YcdF (DUF218 family)
MSVLVTRILESLILPPLGPMLLILLGLVFRRLRIFAWLGLIALYFASIPATKLWLAEQIETVPALETLKLQEGERAAIVVLGGGSDRVVPEFEGAVNYGRGLERLRYGAYLAHKTGLPIVVTGGDPLLEGSPESAAMAATLERDFGLREVIQEPKSLTTHEHGVYVPKLLKEQGFTTMILVTTASHMSRSVRVFEGRGLRVIPAPTGFTVEDAMDKGVFAWGPRASTAEDIRELLHEWLGDLWYRLKHSATYASA